MNNTNQTAISVERIIREAECKQLSGLGRTTRYLKEKEGTFPPRRKLGGRSVGWMLSEIQKWQRDQPVASTDRAS
ncbi:AlpA family phage regulatory protein [Erwinia endophytica]|uniref:AlpA family phage regulatory protein n=1 Tax=Erwinia endophytica TaxID=1563158 RepID=UPI001265ED8E|nr:AlpA family phage regulatory protein [Erwinia endophytica]KAB8311961.1 AlpA family phage regulatory protein [Erwinia endophytica]